MRPRSADHQGQIVEMRAQQRAQHLREVGQTIHGIPQRVLIRIGELGPQAVPQILVLV